METNICSTQGSGRRNIRTTISRMSWRAPLRQLSRRFRIRECVIWINRLAHNGILHSMSKRGGVDIDLPRFPRINRFKFCRRKGALFEHEFYAQGDFFFFFFNYSAKMCKIFSINFCQKNFMLQLNIENRLCNSMPCYNFILIDMSLFASSN